ncbi:helix-turn-helix transcriptional regulator [Actinomadura sp. KC216]|uniref:helix-turn-helix transcriptional regulator n=1 Tax=Actinomadura sp. KC216 TaxID=2530370 RepID=UPI0014044F8D|nr:helix-turn-helix transcriptional regulator [Actinomadura sp. KC216]
MVTVGSAAGPALVGRETQRTAILAAYERARTRRPVTVLVSGEAGIGKSRLVAAVTRDLPGAPLVLAGGCLELGAEGAPYVPFVAVVRELVRRLGPDRVRALLAPAGSALGDWLPELGPAPRRYGRTRLLEEMLALISRVSEAAPVVLVVEDLHWADASSRELFAYLARNLAGCAVLLIGTVRTGELAAGHPNRRLLAELGRGGDVVRLALEPLEHEHVAEFLAALDGRPPDPSRSARIHRRSGGNPLFVEVLRDADEAAADDLKTLLLDRISGLPGPALEVMESLAVAGAELTDELLHEITTMPEESLATVLNDLVGRELVVAGQAGYAVRHDLIREAVYASLLPTRQRRMHARYAGALASRAPDGAALAEHWAAAGEFARALPVAWRAAERAGRQNAYDEQLHLLDLVLARWTQVADPSHLIGADRAAVLEQAAAAAFAAGKSAVGIAHCTAALDLLDAAVDPHRVARLLGLRGRMQNRTDGGGASDLERAITLVPPGGSDASDALRSRLLSALGFVGVVAHHPDKVRHHADEALRLAERLDDDRLRAPALLVVAQLDGAAGELESARSTFGEARRIAEAVGDEHTFLTTFQWEADVIEASGRYAQAADMAHAGQQAAERLGQARSRGSMLAAARASPLTFLGRWDEALVVVQDALTEDPPPLYAAYLWLAAADIARCRGETGRFETLLRQLTEFARHTLGATEAKAALALQRIAWALDQGDPGLADRILGEYLTPPPAWPPHHLLRLAVLGARVQRARRTSAPRNRQVAHQTTERLADLDRMVAGVQSATPTLTAYRVTFHATATSAGLPAWGRAAAAWRDLGNRYETAAVLTDAASTALATNNRPGARSRLREAHAIATDLGAEPLLARINDLIDRGRLGDAATAPARNVFDLTPRELDVLRLLARGRSNPQIAEDLFITTNTVATHVTRILTKLGVATRTEAASRAHQAGLFDTRRH